MRARLPKSHYVTFSASRAQLEGREKAIPTTSRALPLFHTSHEDHYRRRSLPRLFLYCVGPASHIRFRAHDQSHRWQRQGHLVRVLQSW
jgi:hypothetical protein